MIRVIFVCHGRWCIERWKPLKIKAYFKIRPEFTTFLRQIKPDYDANVVKQMQETKDVTENLKAKDQQVWIRGMKNICNRAEEIVLKEIAYR